MEDNKVSTVYIGVRVIPEAKERLEVMAKKERRSLSKQVEYLIMEYTDEKTQKA